MSIAILLHLYYTDLWDEYKEKLKAFPHEFDLYVNLVYSEDTLKTINEIKKDFPDVKVLVSENTGLDIGGNLRLMKYWLDAPTDFLILLHTKKSPHLPNEKYPNTTGEQWRKALLKILRPSEQYRIQKIFENPQIGMIGNQYCVSGIHVPAEEKFKEKNLSLINKYCEKFNLNWDNLQFVAGTMFWVRGEIFKNFFTAEAIDYLLEDLSNTKEYERDNTPAHVIERVFGLIVKEKGYLMGGI